MGLAAIDLPDDTTIIVSESKATILGKYWNKLFSEIHMDHNGANVNRTENGLRYIEVDGHFITVTGKNTMRTIKTCNPTEHELFTCT